MLSDSVKTLNSTYGLKYYKTGNIVTIYADYRATVSSNITVGTLPVGYRPKTNVFVSGYSSLAYLQIDTSGKVVYAPIDSGGWLICNCCYGV